MIFFPKEYTVKTKTSGQYVKGIWVDAPDSDKTITANIAPLSSFEAENLNIGKDGTGKIKIVTDDVLIIGQEGSDNSGDRITYQNKNYEVIKEDISDVGLIPHRTYIGELRK